MKIRELIKDKGFEVIAVDGDTTVATAITKMVDRNIGALLIVENGKTAGIFTERDVMRQWVSEHDPNLTKMKEVALKDLVVVDVTDDVEYAASIMIQKGVRHMPVLDGGRLVSVLSMRDVVKAQVKNLKAEVHYLKDFIKEVG